MGHHERVGRHDRVEQRALVRVRVERQHMLVHGQRQLDHIPKLIINNMEKDI